MSHKVVHLDPERAARAAEALRESDVMREHFSDASLEALADTLADEHAITIDEMTGEILDSEGAPTGKSLEDLTDEYVPAIFIKGTNQQLSFEVGGGPHKKVMHSTLKLKGVNNLPLTGQIPRLGRIRLELEIEVQDVAFITVRHKMTGKVLGAERVHVATVESARRLEE